jgi:hypothetical protein
MFMGGGGGGGWECGGEVKKKRETMPSRGYWSFKLARTGQDLT